MRAHRGFYVAAAIGAATLALTACSSDDKPEDKKSSTSISSIMGVPDYANVDWDAQQRAIEEETAKCMREAGWEYTPVEYPDMGSDMGDYSEEDELKRLEREGLGITYWTLNNYSEDGDYVDPWAEWEDPNMDYTSTLTEAELEAYNEALWGVWVDAPAGSEDAEVVVGDDIWIDPNPQVQESKGCYELAQELVYGDDPSNNPEYWDLIVPFYDDLNARVEADPRVAELNEKWSKCMKDAGYDFKTQDDFWEWVYTEFDSRQQEVLGEDFYQDPFADWSDDEINEFFENASQEELDEMFKQPELTADQRAQLEEILDEEIKIAVAQFTCGSELDKKIGDIYTEIEEKFALEHEDELRALAAQLNGSK